MPNPPVCNRLSSEDSIFLYLEKKEMPLHIGAACIFDGEVALEEFTAFVESKLPLIPRYRQRVAVPPLHLGHPCWEPDPGFDIRRHISQATLKRGTDAELEEFTGDLFGQVMPRDRPLWDITLVHGLKRGRTAMIARLHHCLADGIAGVAILNLLLDASPEPEPVPPHEDPGFPPPAAGHSVVDALVGATSDAVKYMLAAEAAALDLAAKLAGTNARGAVQSWLELIPEILVSLDRLPFNAPCKGPRRHIWTSYPMPEIAVIREKLGGTLNDVALTMVTLAVSRYAVLHGQSVEKRLLRYWVPINLRAPGEEAGTGNRISILPVLIPLDCGDARQLLAEVYRRTQELKRSHLIELIGMAQAWLGASPPPLQAAFGLLGNVLPVSPFHLVCTNVPGPAAPLYLMGRRMVASYPYVPIGNDMGFCCAMQSYCDRFFFGLTADREVVPDVFRIREFLDQAFEALRRAAAPPRRPRAARNKTPEPLTEAAAPV